ncbi:MAG: ribonuclease Y [Candidatus Omnitrophica bacterium]|nr:ribonuclease Y [Candidatus Omnitrophota bacterium]
MSQSFLIVQIMIGAVLFLIGYFARRFLAERKIQSAEKKVRDLLEEGERKNETILKEAEREAQRLLYQSRENFEKETEERRQELLTLEKRVLQREENIDRKVEILDKKEKELTENEKVFSQKASVLHKRNQELDTLISEEKSRLSRISSLSPEEAKAILLERMEGDLSQEGQLLIQKMEERVKEESDSKAKRVLALAIGRCAAEYTAESTITVVNLPNDEMKGRIIGKEGRNIRALEALTGVDVVIDDTPESVVLSSFDMLRREVARLALERLIVDGRIHPARIEEVVVRVKQEMDEKIKQEGEQAILEIGCQNVHPEITKLLGRLRYRTSYSQNVLVHLKEVAHLMGVMAAELGEDYHLARRIGLLHDLGKAVSQEVEGTHAIIGGSLARKFGESEIVANAIEAHHGEIDPKSTLAILIQAGDAISASRPGARGETLEAYIRRLQQLESIANSFKGVERSFAIQAGREIRIIVNPEQVNDLEAIALARDIRKRVEGEIEFPGQIKVTVVRETRAVEFAK